MDRPDIALVVKASFNNTSRRITFPSAAKCRLNALFARITESFSLGASSFHIAYTDEDGEDFDIVSEADLTEAVSYFSSGLDADDYGTSLGAPTLYSADWNNAAHDHTTLPVFQPSSRNKIILRVHVVVEYDGPSLSDTASIMESASESSAGAWAQEESSSENTYTDETSDYSGIGSRRHGAHHERVPRFSSVQPRELPRSNESSTDRFVQSQGPDLHLRTMSTGSSRLNQDARSFESSESDRYRRSSASMGFSETERRHVDTYDESNLRRRTSSRLEDQRVDNAFRSLSLNSRPDSYHQNGEQDWNSRPTSHQASLTSLHDPRTSNLSLDKSLISSQSAPRGNNGAPSSSLTSSELGARWIREQTERVRRKLGPISSSGGSSRSSLASEEGSDDDQTSIYSEGRGNLELVRETNGKWYYSYSSADMPGQGPTRDTPLSERRSMASLGDSAYADDASRRDGQDITSLRLSMTSINTDPFRRHGVDYASSEVSPIETESLQTPPEVAEEFEEPVGPPGLAPDCSACGVRLEYMRYVCTVCGEGHFWLESDDARRCVLPSAGEDRDSEDSSSSASSGDQTTWAPPRMSSNLGQLSRQPPVSNEDTRNSGGNMEDLSSREGLSHRKHARNGYELCPACIELRGIQHTKAMGEIETNKPGTNGPTQNIRKFGTLNHTYKELLWGAKGWKEIGISCPAFDLCRTCHQNAQEIHPAHPFLAVPDQKRVARPSSASPSPAQLPSMPPHAQYPGINGTWLYTANPGHIVVLTFVCLSAVKHAGVFCHK
ncbi:hypothetical protein QFC22_001065 [Naganishia vaughanmartiniae]|uniref:Uncharacterized protein n=1 Tax=Naganishia vaughanmartiniae TaxID=1424756 RepID=A0ACC2XKU7_9TREE|nr:hypothetical protein QFC22_001065 [Naganishia vaughanmartiniae]